MYFAIMRPVFFSLTQRSFSRTSAEVWNLIPSDWRDASRSFCKKKKLADLYFLILF